MLECKKTVHISSITPIKTSIIQYHSAAAHSVNNTISIAYLDVKKFNSVFLNASKVYVEPRVVWGT